MKKSYTFYLVVAALMVTAMILFGIIYPAPLYSPGDVVKTHSKLKCSDCHAPFNRVSSESCSIARCHEAGKISKKLSLNNLHKKVEKQDCLLCHTDHKGAKGNITIAFGHNNLSAKSGCVGCHKSEGVKAHKGKYGNQCKACHTTKDWKAVSFSHEKVSVTPCADCHKGPKDELHISVGKDCKSCHSTKAWKPSTYDHVKYFPLNKEHKVGCKKCHDTSVYKKYTCMNCHVHATRGIISEHREEGVRNYGDCLRCHQIYINGRRYGTGKVDDSMIDDDYNEYRRGDRYRHDDDNHRSNKGLFDRFFDDDDDD